MARPSDNYPRWSGQAFLDTGDSTKTIQGAPGAGKQLVVTAYAVHVTTAAAQATDLEDADGTVEVLKMAASQTAHSHLLSPQMEQGLALTANKALVLKPAAAGPAMHCWAEGYIKPTASGA